MLKEILASVKANLPSHKRIQDLIIEESNDGFGVSFKSHIHQSKKPSLIAEFKRESPSKGKLNPDIKLKQTLDIYSRYASAISILTEPRFFGGSLNDLKKAREITSLPILRKDFIIDPIQIKEARYYGANAYLLIVAALSKNQLSELIDAGREFSMDVLIEVHRESELELALELNPDILGINNRNLNDLSIDLNTTERLMKMIPEDILEGMVIVSESGLYSREDILSLPKRVDAVLIGTSFMLSEDPELLLKEMFS